MSFRAIAIGLLLAVGISVFGYFNDWIMQQAFLATNLIPICVFGVLVLALVVLYPLLLMFKKKGLSPAEWCVITALMLVACVIPGPGLMWHFSNSLVTPHREQAVNPGWRKQNLLGYAPKVMLTDTGQKTQDTPYGKNYDIVVGGFRAGMPGSRIDIKQVPWGAWRRTLTFWLPLLGLSFVSGISLVRIVHQQWSQRERLRYPLAYVASEMIHGWAPDEQGVFRNKKFWLGFLVPVVILLVNGYVKWNTKSIEIPLHVYLESQLGAKWPIIRNVPGIWWILNPEIFFSAVGFAYFVSSDISFSIGINGIVFAAAFLPLYIAGIDISGAGMEGGNYNHLMFGAYLGIGLVIFYTGRKFYATVLAKALCIPSKEPAESNIVWACRIALATAAGMVLILVFVAGLNLLLAILYVMLIGLTYVVLTRINVETGLFMIQPGWAAAGVLLGLLGFAAIGPNMLIIVGILCTVIAVDPIVSLMPLAANAIKLGQSENIAPNRLSRWMVVAVLLALVTGVLGTITVQYTYGVAGRYGWADSVAKQPFSMLQRNLQKLPPDPGEGESFSFAAIAPSNKFLSSAAIGLVLVTVLSILRLRYTWWPIHPVLFLVWGTFPGYILGASFLLGWLIKTGVTTFGGGKSYRSARPFFIGLIAGEFAAAIFWVLVGMTYYLVEDMAGPVFRILPA